MHGEDLTLPCALGEHQVLSLRFHLYVKAK